MKQADIAHAIGEGSLYRSPAAPTAGRVLLVFVPGWTLKPGDFDPLLLGLLGESGFEDGDLLPYAYDNRAASSADPRQVALDLADLIREAAAERGYARIYLMGHSIGALLIRAAFLEARARGDGWVDAVSRLILLAGTNRGFVPGTWQQRTGAFLVSFLNATFGLRIARLIMEAQFGSEWVTALRMSWLRTFSAKDATPPPIVQLYGADDRVVSAEDALDINRFDNSAVERLAGVDHDGFCRLGPGDPAFLRIRDAFFRELPGGGRPRILERSGLVFLIHGIRDFAEWHYALDYVIENQDEAIAVIPVQYGYFNILQFLLPHQQRRAVRVFVDKYVQEVSLSPMAWVAVGAHSNGTRVFEQAVRANEFIRVDRAFLAGSVLPTGIPWGEEPYRRRVREVRNMRATQDVPVGFLCRALQWVPILGRDLGTAGFDGFGKPTHDRCLDGGHGVALQANHREEMARYLVGDESVLDSPAPSPCAPPRWMRVLNRAAPIAVPLVLLLLYLAYSTISRAPDGLDVALSAALTLLLLIVLQRI